MSDEELFDEFVVKIDDDSEKQAHDIEVLDRMMTIALICSGALFVVGSTLVVIIESLISMLCS